VSDRLYHQATTRLSVIEIGFTQHAVDLRLHVAHAGVGRKAGGQVMYCHRIESGNNVADSPYGRPTQGCRGCAATTARGDVDAGAEANDETAVAMGKDLPWGCFSDWAHGGQF